jgi:hypothetical protein
MKLWLDNMTLDYSTTIIAIDELLNKEIVGFVPEKG